MQLGCASDAVLYEKPNYWRVGALVPAEDEWKHLVPIYKNKGGVKTFAILSMDTLHNKGAAKGFEAELKKNGFEVVYSGIAPPPTKNFAPMITKIKQRGTVKEWHTMKWLIFFHTVAYDLSSIADVLVGLCFNETSIISYFHTFLENSSEPLLNEYHFALTV